MNIELPAIAISASARLGLMAKRWLVIQTKTDGSLVYAKAFVRRAGAERARQEADDRRTSFLSSRNKAWVVRLPYDKR